MQTNRSLIHFSVGSQTVLSLNHDTDTLVTHEKGGTVKTWLLGASAYQQNHCIQTEHMAFCRTQVLPDKNLIMCPQGDNVIGVYTLDDLSLQQSFVPAADDKLGALMCFRAIQVHGQSYVLAGYESGAFITWDLRCSKAVNCAQFDENPMAVDYDVVTNRGVFGSCTDKIGVFTYYGGTEIHKKTEIPIKNAGVNCVRIRGDRKVFTTAGWDGRVRIFSWKSMRPLAVLTEHKAGVMDIAFSSGPVSMWQANIMAVAGLDGQITLWDLYN